MLQRAAELVGGEVQIELAWWAGFTNKIEASKANGDVRFLDIGEWMGS